MTQPSYFVAIIGGAVAGSEAARSFADSGAGVVVFEQNPRPYGKIEDGLPVWHDKMRLAEFSRIDEVYQKENVYFVPNTRIGRDISFADFKTLGFQFVILANGAWRDRPLGLANIDAYQGKGFYYQNPFMYWINHREDKNFKGTPCEIAEGAIVIGGGLASIDVAKAFSILTVQQALEKRGIAVDWFELEHKGCDKILAEHNLSFETLGVKPCTLFYRRRLQDMPLVAYKDGASEEDKAKTEKTRLVLLNKAMQKYGFTTQELSCPVAALIEHDRVVGIRFNKEGEEFEVRAPVVVSSIGSIPEPLPGIAQEGELYRWSDISKSYLAENIYGLGNVVTGKGNIAVSRKHSKEVTEWLRTHPTHNLSDAEKASLIERVKARQKVVGYDGNYNAWLEKHPPVDRA